MRYLLGARTREILAQYAWSKVLLAFDFDGTLAPIVRVPGDAALRSATRRLLRELCARYPCAVISGRSRDDLRSRLDGVPVPYLVGNHGIEPSQDLLRFEIATAALRERVSATLGDEPGVEIEDKRYSLAIHYRRARSKSSARAAIARSVATLGGSVRNIGGKFVVNVLPEGAPHKGIALEALRDRHGADTAIYVGDDATDEDVFALDRPGRLLCVRVGRSSRSHAAYYLRDQRDVDRLLRELVRLRDEASHGVPVPTTV